MADFSFTPEFSPATREFLSSKRLPSPVSDTGRSTSPFSDYDVSESEFFGRMSPFEDDDEDGGEESTPHLDLPGPEVTRRCTTGRRASIGTLERGSDSDDPPPGRPAEMPSITLDDAIDNTTGRRPRPTRVLFPFAHMRQSEAVASSSQVTAARPQVTASTSRVTASSSQVTASSSRPKEILFTKSREDIEKLRHLRRDLCEAYVQRERLAEGGIGKVTAEHKVKLVLDRVESDVVANTFNNAHSTQKTLQGLAWKDACSAMEAERRTRSRRAFVGDPYLDVQKEWIPMIPFRQLIKSD